jgi:hypothetical protein
LRITDYQQTEKAKIGCFSQWFFKPKKACQLNADRLFDSTKNKTQIVSL